MDKPLRVSRLVENDFMRITALDIQPGRKSLIILRGDNEQGKTSGLRALISAMGGKKLDPDTPIREGQEGATVDVILSDEMADRLRVSVSWTQKGRYLTVKQIDGDQEFKLSSGQTVLDSLVNSLAFDPVKFLGLSADKQLAMLMQAVGLQEAYDQNRLKTTKLYDQRRDINRTIKDQEANLKQNPDPNPSEQLEPTDVNVVQSRIEEAMAHNAKLKENENKLHVHARETERMIQDCDEKRRHITVLENEVVALQASIMKRQAVYADAHAKFDDQEPIAVESLTSQIAKIQQHNAVVDQQKTAIALVDKIKETKQEADICTQGIATLDKEIASMLGRSDIGQKVPGLAIKEGGLTHDGLAISQASGMRQLELSCLIGMAGKNQFKALCIDEGDKLDKASLKHLEQLATDNDYQLWMTAVYAGTDDSDDRHIVNIVDGASPDASPPPPPEPANSADVEDMYAGLDLGPAPEESADIDLLDL